MSSEAVAPSESKKEYEKMFVKKRDDLEINKFFKLQIKFEASDLHLQVGKPAMLRVRGTIRELDMPPIEEEPP